MQLRQKAKTCLCAISLAALFLPPASAQAQRMEIPGGVTVSGGGGGSRNDSAAPGARIEQRVRSGAAERATPLTVTRRDRRGDGGRWVYTGRGYDRGGYYRDRRDYGFPGLLAAPFLLPWYLLGGGYYDGGTNMGPYYEDPWASDPAYYPAYPGPSTTFSAPLGQYCATPQKVCLLYQPAEVGVGCSCRAPAGLPRFRGAVVP